MDLFVNYSDEDSLFSPLPRKADRADDKQHFCATLSIDMQSFNTEFGEHQGTNPELYFGHLLSPGKIFTYTYNAVQPKYEFTLKLIKESPKQFDK